MKRTLVLSLVVGASVVVIGTAMAASQNGRGGVMPAYYDGQVFNINFKELPSGGESAVLAHNKSINIIYTFEEDDLIDVIDAIQGDGFNPLWQEVEVTFNAGVTPFQLESDDEVLDAAADDLVTLTETDEVYRCSVVGPKTK
jgi:hypothetical protein